MQLDPSLTLQTVAGLIGAEFLGLPDFLITGLNEIHMVQPADLTFVDHPKYYDKQHHSNATTILIKIGVPCPQGKAMIFLDDSFGAYVSLVKQFKPFEKAVAAISHSAKHGEGTVIQPNAFVGNHVVIGKNCIIH